MVKVFKNISRLPWQHDKMADLVKKGTEPRPKNLQTQSCKNSKFLNAFRH